MIRTRQIKGVSEGELNIYHLGDIIPVMPIVQAERGEAGIYLEYRVESFLIAQRALAGLYSTPVMHTLKATSAVWTEAGWTCQPVSLHVRGPMRPRGCELIVGGKRPITILCGNYDPTSHEDTPLMLGDDGDDDERRDCWARLVGEDDIIAEEASPPEP